MSGNKPLVYWDSCIFIAWLKDEERNAGEMEGVRGIVERIESSDIRLVTSVLTHTEILRSKYPEKHYDILDQFFMKKCVRRAQVDIQIAKLASKIRDYYNANSDDEAGRIKTPDAIHLATAIHYECAELHTFDDPILELNGDIAGFHLQICKPQADQLEFKYSD